MNGSKSDSNTLSHVELLLLVASHLVPDLNNEPSINKTSS